jgi:hypothetical protein
MSSVSLIAFRGVAKTVELVVIKTAAPRLSWSAAFARMEGAWGRESVANSSCNVSADEPLYGKSAPLPLHGSNDPVGDVLCPA